ncbi:14169_t:CDS:2 [Funneliformis caledonium]|uniref:14169_t:CDS:1 n=1 Tax=Funneliformis caledonium TaxID=1117310 RepID=A0A9N8ZHG0_9GLOM|nr:14169_t:CDS:2 [Funneliformis caledonium]
MSSRGGFTKDILRKKNSKFAERYDLDLTTRVNSGFMIRVRNTERSGGKKCCYLRGKRKYGNYSFSKEEESRQIDFIYHS